MDDGFFIIWWRCCNFAATIVVHQCRQTSSLFNYRFFSIFDPIHPTRNWGISLQRDFYYNPCCHLWTDLDGTDNLFHQHHSDLSAHKYKSAMKYFYFELAGLIFFIISGIFFIAAGIRSGDYLSVIGSIIWTFACFLWLIPILARRNSQN
jgi:hypothetical protein